MGECVITGRPTVEVDLYGRVVGEWRAKAGDTIRLVCLPCAGTGTLDTEPMDPDDDSEEEDCYRCGGSGGVSVTLTADPERFVAGMWRLTWEGDDYE